MRVIHQTDPKLSARVILNLFGEQQVVIRDGKEVTVTVDEEYIKKVYYSILILRLLKDIQED